MDSIQRIGECNSPQAGPRGPRDGVVIRPSTSGYRLEVYFWPNYVNDASHDEAICDYNLLIAPCACTKTNCDAYDAADLTAEGVALGDAYIAATNAILGYDTTMTNMDNVYYSTETNLLSADAVQDTSSIASAWDVEEGIVDDAEDTYNNCIYYAYEDYLSQLADCRRLNPAFPQRFSRAEARRTQRNTKQKGLL